MPEGYPKKLTEDAVTRILLAPRDVSSVALATEFGVHVNTIDGHRRRRTRWSLKLARKLGLPPLDAKPAVSPDDETRVYVVQGVRG